MDRYLGQLWSPAMDRVKPKRKLQKANAQQQQQQRPYSVNYSDTKIGPEPKSQKIASSFNLFSSPKPSVPQRHALPPPTNPDDGKWLEDFRKSGYLCRDGRRSRQSDNDRTRAVSMVVAPEFAHLAVASSPPTERTISPPVRDGPPQITRRYAKTPVLHIGQLETHPLLRTQGASQDAPSIESIAESYRALLESRCSFQSEAAIEHSPIMEKHDRPFTPQDPSLVPPPLEPVAEVPEPPMSRGSPRSDDGTLVGEDSTDFKMASISSVPSTPSWTSHETALSRPRRSAAILPETPDLQTCLDLLTKQLSSAVNSSHTQPNADTTALQVWAMIEAYEKLRDQVTTTREGEVQDSPLGPVFDMWLKALHSVHEGMVGNDGQRSESDYGD